LQGRVYSLSQLGGSDEEFALFRGGDEDVVLVFALLLGAVLEGGDTVAGLFVVEPLSLVLESVAAIADAESRPLVVLPLAHVDLRHVGLQNLFRRHVGKVRVAVVLVHVRHSAHRLNRRSVADVALNGGRGVEAAGFSRAALLRQIAGALLLPQLESGEKSAADLLRPGRGFPGDAGEDGSAPGERGFVAARAQDEPAARVVLPRRVGAQHGPGVLLQRSQALSQRFRLSVVRRQAVWGARPDAVSVTHPAQPLTLESSSVGVELYAVSVLQSVGPSALVFGSRGVAQPDAVSAFEAVRPLSAVYPPPLGLHAQAVPLPAHPLALVVVAAGPRVDALHLEPVGPLTRVLALALGPGADAVAVGFPILPIAAIRPAVIKVESTTA